MSIYPDLENRPAKSFGRKLESFEVEERKRTTFDIVNKVLTNPNDHWRYLITEAWICGSTIRGEAKEDSDVDVVFVSKMSGLASEDNQLMNELLASALEIEMQNISPTKLHFKIHSVIVRSDCWANPDNGQINEPIAIKTMKKEAIRFFEQPPLVSN